MGFLLETQGCQPPTWPHLFCAGAADLSGRGWAWHNDPSRRKCYSADEVGAPADLVADAIDGRDIAGIDRLHAIVRLRQEGRGAFSKVFRRVCYACEGNHRTRATRILQAFAYIHPDALDSLRDALVPERNLREPLLHEDGFRLPLDPKEVKKLLRDSRMSRKVKRLLRTAHNIPVWVGDKERTRAAQIAYARQYALRKGTTDHAFTNHAGRPHETL